MLTPAEERQLAYAIARGDAEARDKMIRTNLRLVVSIAKNYTDRGMSFLDLIEEGNLGLLKAVGRFSPDQGCKFSTYACWWIKQTIRRALINKVKPVRVPAYMFEVLSRWKRASATLSQKLGRDPGADEIGKYLKLSPNKIAIVRKALGASAPLGRGGDPDSPYDLEDILAGAPSKEDDSDRGEFDREALLSAFEFALTERERQIIELRYGIGRETRNDDEPCTLEKIGERIGLTRERVRQIENQALRKLQIFLKQKDAREELARQQRRRIRIEIEQRKFRRPKRRASISRWLDDMSRSKPRPKAETRIEQAVHLSRKGTTALRRKSDEAGKSGPRAKHADAGGSGSRPKLREGAGSSGLHSTRVDAGGSGLRPSRIDASGSGSRPKLREGAGSSGLHSTRVDASGSGLRPSRIDASGSGLRPARSDASGSSLRAIRDEAPTGGTRPKHNTTTIIRRSAMPG